MKKQSLFVAFAMFSLIGFGQVPNYVPTNGLVGYWPFNGNANDVSGNANDGTVNGAVLTSDRFGNTNTAYSFDGANDRIEVPHTPALSLGQLTISVWGNANNFLNSDLNQSQVVSKREYSGWGNAYEIGIGKDPTTGYSSSSQNSSYANYSTPSNEVLSHASNTLETDSWFHMVYSHTSDYARIYVNGVLVAEDLSTSTLTANNLDVWFGARPDGGGRHFFNGALDDIGIWNRALTEEEIQALYIGCNVAPTTIAGNLTPATLTTADYACNNNSGSTYQWTVTNGVITAGQGTSNVTVLWGAEGIGTLSVVETNSEGCSGAPATIEVNVTCVTSATAISGPLGPNALTATTYTCDGDAGSTYQWSISSGVISSGQGTNTVTVLWAGTGLGNISVQETTNVNCVGNTISMDVVVIPTGVEELESPIAAIYPNPAKDIVTIDFGKTSSVHGQSINIVNSLGQVVNSFNVTSQLVVVDVSTWASGTYLLSVLNGTGTQVQTKTLIIE